MTLNRSQKKYLKKKLKRLSLAKIASDLGVSEEEILEFLKSHWRKEKYQKFLAKQEQVQGEKTPRTVARQRPRLLRGEMLAQNWQILAFLAFLVFAVYLNSLGNDFVSDDIGTISENPNIGQLSYLAYFKFNLRSLIIFLTHKIFGLNPAFYRLSNILLHLGSSWIIYFLIGSFFQSPVPLITASIFTVHPVLTESVTWISGGAYSNPVFFILLSFLTYIWPMKKKVRLYLVSVFLFFLALLGSQKLIIFPLILLLYEFCFGELKTNWRKLIPFWAISGFWTLYLVGLLGARTAVLEAVHYQESGLHNPLIQIPIAIASYLELIFWPKNLTLYHSEMLFNQLEYFLRLGVFVLFLATIFYFFKKDRRIFFWLSFFLITLTPTLTPFRISWIVAERYVYLGALGIFVIVALAIKKLGEWLQSTSEVAGGTPRRWREKKTVTYILLGIILIALSARTIARNADWKNQDTLWLATAKTSPSSPQNHNNLGDLYGRRGDLERAVEEFKIAIELKPNYGDAYHNLANTYQQMGKNDLAVANYQKAIFFNPNLWQSYQNLAAIYFEQEKFELARQELERAIDVNPQNSNLHTNLGIVYLKLGEKEKAKEAFQQALQIDPQNQRAKQELLSL